MYKLIANVEIGPKFLYKTHDQVRRSHLEPDVSQQKTKHQGSGVDLCSQNHSVCTTTDEDQNNYHIFLEHLMVSGYPKKLMKV